MKRPLIVGTRGSALALAQVALVEKELRRIAPGLRFEVRKVTTSGDRSQEIRHAQESGAGLKGLFTKEIEDLLLDRSIDVAVHSLKDLPGHTPPGLSVAAVLERADTSDVLISRKAHQLDELPPRAIVATSSVRRARQLRWMRSDLRVEEIRGNVPTRVQKLRDTGSWDAIVLARAGLDRLGLELSDLHVSPLSILPAIGQGAIAMETRVDSAETNALLARINHGPTFLCIRAERELLRLLNGDCNLPVGASTIISGNSMRMKAIVFAAENKPPATAEAEGPSTAPEAVARQIFAMLTQATGSEPGNTSLGEVTPRS